jgi:hypothetical protein
VGDFTISRNVQNGLPEVVIDGTLSFANIFNGYGEVKGQDFAVNWNNISSWDLFHN